MATPRKSPYAKAFDRALKLHVEWACTNDPPESLTTRAAEAAGRLAHWESHVADAANCPWCLRYPPLSG